MFGHQDDQHHHHDDDQHTENVLTDTAAEYLNSDLANNTTVVTADDNGVTSGNPGIVSDGTSIAMPTASDDPFSGAGIAQPADMPAPSAPAVVGDPAPAASDTPAPATESTAPASSDLLSLKQQALTSLSPLVGHLDQSPEERFRTTMMMIQASDNQDLIKDAYEAANQIADEKVKAQALLDIVNEINYFTQQPAG